MNTSFTAKTWGDLESFYSNLASTNDHYEEMAQLISYIKNGDLASRIYADTSLTTLIISIYNPIIWNIETLNISFDPTINSWIFKYYPNPYQKVEHERQYKNNLIENFEKYIALLKW